MASNFFQRWSERSLAKNDHATTDLVASKDAVIATAEPDLQPDIGLSTEAKLDNTLDQQAESVADLELSSTSTDVTNEQVEAELTIDDADKVTFDSGVASFLQHGVDKSVKKAALQKLFHADEFNYISDMDDHTEDFSNIPKLDESVAKQLRGWINKLVEDEPELVEEEDIAAIENAKTESDVVEDDEIESVDVENAEIADPEFANPAVGNKQPVIVTITAPVTVNNSAMACCADEKNQLQQHLQQTGET